MEPSPIDAPNSRPATPGPRIVIRGVNWLGDAVMTTPALQRLREAQPEAHLTLLTHEKLSDLWRGHPSLDAVLAFTPRESPWRVARRLREQRFDIGLVLPNSPRSALELWLAGIPQRIGYRARWRSWLLTHALRPRPGAIRMRKRSPAEIRRLIQSPSSGTATPFLSAAHQMREYLRLVAALGANPEPVPPRVSVSEREVEVIGRKFEVLTPEGRPRLLFGLNGGAEYGPAKRWPAERFVATAVQVQHRADCRWLIFGGARDRDAATHIAREIERAAGAGKTSATAGLTLNLAGATSLRELCVLLRLCRVLLTNDTGPMHVAAAVGTPVVALFGSTSPELTGPGLPADPRHRLLCAGVPCAPCFRRQCPIDFRCMNSLTVEQAVEAVLAVSGIPAGS